MVNNNDDIVTYNKVEEATIPGFTTEEEILASFGYKQVDKMVAYTCQTRIEPLNFLISCICY